MGSCLSIFDIFAADIFPDMYRGKQSYGSIFGFCQGLLVIGLGYLMYLFYNSSFKDYDYQYEILPKLNLNNFNSKVKNNFVENAYNSDYVFGGENNNNLYIKIKGLIQDDTKSSESQTYFDQIQDTSCSNTDGYCFKSNYWDYNTLEPSSGESADISINLNYFQGSTEDYENSLVELDKLLNGSSESITLKNSKTYTYPILEDICEQSKVSKDCKTNYEYSSGKEKVNYKEMLNYSIPVFQDDQYSIGLGDILIINIMMDSEFLNNHVIGMASNLIYSQKIYDRNSTESIKTYENHKNIPKEIENKSDMWMKLGRFYKHKSLFTSSDGYTGPPMFNDFLNIISFDQSTILVDQNKFRNLDFLKTDFSQDVLTINNIDNLKLVSQEKIHIFEDEDFQQLKTSTKQFTNDQVIVGQYILVNSGYKQLIIAHGQYLDVFLVYLGTWFFLFMLIFCWLGKTCNQYFFKQYFYREVENKAQVMPLPTAYKVDNAFEDTQNEIK